MNNLKTIIASFVIAFNLSANETGVGRITDVIGSGFVSYNGHTTEIKKGMIIYPKSEIVMEHSGHATYVDNFEHRFNLTNSTSVIVLNNSVELRSGDVWFQSTNKADLMKFNTANATIEFNAGEAIVTYDVSKGKTQLMVINGLMKIANLRVPDLNVSVSEGNFSYVSNSYDEGAPRDPTPVGESTYKALVSEFKNIRPLDKNTEMIFKSTHESTHGEVTNVEATHHEIKREVASVHEEINTEVKKEFKKINLEDKNLENYKEGLLKTPTASKKVAHGGKKLKILSSKKVSKEDKEAIPLVVTIYGMKKKSAPTEKHDRAPASVETPVELKKEPKLNNENTPNKETINLLNKLKEI